MRQRTQWRRGGVAVAAAVLWAAAAPAVVIDIGDAVGSPGSSVPVSVSLQSQGDAVLATQNRIDFERSAPIGARGDGQPDCAVNPAIDKNATGFRFLPLGCNPSLDCQSVRVFVIAFDNLAPIADGSVLYTCRIAVPADAEIGNYALRNAEAGASAAGGVLLSTTGTDGNVQVIAASPTPTATPTNTATPSPPATSTPVSTDTPAPTNTPAPTDTPEPTHTATPPPACAGDCNGDGVVLINELLAGVNISTGTAPVAQCEAIDVDHNGDVVISELIQAVNRALNGCPT